MKPSSNSITGERERERERLSERLSGAIFSNRKHHQPSSSRTVFLSWSALLSLRGGRNSGRRSNLIARALQSNRGFALVISLGLVALIMIVTINLTRTMIENTRQFADIEQTAEAYYAAEGALNRGALANKGKGAGYQAKVACDKTGKCVDQDNDYSQNGINYLDINGAYGTWTVQGRTRCLWDTDPATDPSVCESVGASTYYIPRPGTGDAGSKCDPLGEYPSADDPCNWAKIRVGEKVAIPLYITNSDESVTSPWDDSNYGLQGIKLRVRTPCTAETGDYNRFPCKDDYGNSARYVLNQDDDKNIYENEGDTLLSWQISGNCDVDVDDDGNFQEETDDEEGCTLLPMDEFENERRVKKKNSEIYEKLINDAGGNYTSHPYEVLASRLSSIWGGDENSQGKDMNGVYGYIADFITNSNQCGADCNNNPIPATANWTQSHINQPVLKLNLIHSLKDDKGGNIPYLEYQVILEMNSNTGTIPADIYQTIIGEGYSGNFKQSVEMKKGLKTGVIDFVIQN